jgi:hypothetical protein
MPLLFVFSNIIAIPLAMITLYGSIILIFISSTSFAALYLGKILTASIWLLNHTVLFINSLPLSLWDGFSFSATETIILYFIVTFFLYWLIKKNNIAFKLDICSSLFFSIIIFIKNW